MKYLGTPIFRPVGTLIAMMILAFAAPVMAGNPIKGESQELQTRQFDNPTIKAAASETKRFDLTREQQDYLRDKGEIRMCTAPSTPPFAQIKNGVHEGIAADVIAKLEEIIGTKMILVPTRTWNETIEFARERRCDMVSYAGETPQRKQFLNFTRPYLSFPIVIVARNNQPVILTLEPFLKETFGGTKGSAYIEHFKERYPKAHVIEFDSNLDGLEGVRNGTLFAYVSALPIVAYQIQLHGFTDLKVAGQLEEKFDMSIATRNDEPLLGSVFQTAIDALTQEQRQSIINRWFAVRFEQGYDYSLMWKLGAVVVVLLTGVLIWNRHLSNLHAKISRQNAELAVAAAVFNSQEGMFVTDLDGMILRVNKAFTEISGYSPEDAIGQTPQLLKSGHQNADLYQDMWKAVKRTGVWQGEVWNRRKNGDEYLAWLSISAIKNDDGVIINYVGSQFDISERKKAENRINELAFFDQLTGLPNRTLLMDRLRQSMAASSRSSSYGALFFIDLDNFKTLNDTLGHNVGDLLLKLVAQRLTALVRAGDTVARFGGDEFVLVLPDLNVVEAEAASHVETVGAKILAVLNQPYQLGEVAYRCTPSIGVTLFKGQTAFDELLKQADLAMYKSKAAGRNTLRFFDPDMKSAVMERASLEMDIREAIQEKQFLLYYQPQIVSPDQVVGAEALLRWRHPKRGMVSPTDFIPLAEETGLILPLGEWVLETACAQLAEWANWPEMAHLSIAVNVSAHQFHQTDFVEQVRRVLQRTGGNPNRLKLELTESLLVINVDDIIEKMLALKAFGTSFSLDDFGTGYSSLTYLKRLPLEQLKIDQSFVRAVLGDHADAAIVKTIVALAESLKIDVIAEGVETVEQRDFLAKLGCLSYQGYFFSYPLPIKDFEEYVRRGGLGQTNVPANHSIKETLNKS